MKSNLETRFQSENVECFPEAVEGICAAFDESQKDQATCERDEHDHLVSEAVLDDGLEDCEGLDSGKDRNGQVGSKNYERSTPSNDGTDPEGSIPEITRNGYHDASLKFDHSSPRQPEGNDQAKKPSTSIPVRSSSAALIFYVRKRKRKNVRKEDQDDSRREMMNGHKVDEVDRYEGPNEKSRSNSLPVNSIVGDGIVGRTEQLKYRRKGRVASSGNKEETLVDSGDADVGEMRKVKKWSKEKDKSEIAKGAIDASAETGVQFQGGISEEKQTVLGLGHRPSRGSGGRHIDLKHVERRTIAKEPLNKSMRNSLDVKHLAKRQGLVKKDEKTFASKADIRGVQSNSSGDEAAPPLTKRRRLAMEDMSDFANSSSDDKEQRFSLESRQNLSSIIENPVMHGQKKRRAVRIFDEEDDECPKTPIHGGAPKKLKDSSMPCSSQKATATHSVNLNNGQGAAAKPTGREVTRRKELSPKKYSNAHFMTKQAPEKQNPSKSVIKFSETGSERKVSPVPTNSPLFSSDGLKSHNGHSTKVIQTSSRERPKNNTRFENGDEDMKTQESVMSMKHLIAAAQAKRKQTHMDNGTARVSVATLASSEVLGRNLIPSPSPPVLTSVSSLAHKDAPNLNQLRNSKSSPTSADVSQRQANAETAENKTISSEQKGLLSCGTEAAVARDAFEGMIETLSRTRESIRRATRLAIDCAKYGIAHEVVELLIRKLESEPSLHRKVDLFFLVDSITQRSHSHKGIAGASYIPTVQAALPRLLSAAAPTNSGGAENRRQCLKVLRLWLERKIFPKSFIMSCMDDVGTSKNSTTNPRRPSRVQRAVDDPLREMEGVLVDEYGSNATFQLSGLRTSHAFEEEEEEEDHENLRTHHGKGSPRASPVQSTPASGDMGIYDVTPSDWYHCVLEDVNQGFNKEDASGQSKDEKYLVRSNSGLESKKLEVSRMESAYGVAPGVSTLSAVSPSFLENFPPLPPDSPPPSPALPYSPPPFPLSAPPAQPPLPSEPTSGWNLKHSMGNQAGKMSLYTHGGLPADAGTKMLVTQQSRFLAPVGVMVTWFIIPTALHYLQGFSLLG
ncbi:hypothetical protein MLD38_003809 [Melastoma candidum]|uniref:Uncharacterized protein n=1 Tax=Melastoma candidum TaxID=119954 RepID=A0ACB9S2Y8_9MYRT|nr:hypothetical protein MLD38_003809 [Melastoma candidum]